MNDTQLRLLAERLHGFARAGEVTYIAWCTKIFAHLETELMDNLQEHAETEAISVFAQRRQSGTTPNIDNVGHDLCIGAGDHGSSSASRTLGRLLVTSGDGGGATPDSMDHPGRVLDIILDYGDRGSADCHQDLCLGTGTHRQRQSLAGPVVAAARGRRDVDGMGGDCGGVDHGEAYHFGGDPFYNSVDRELVRIGRS